MNLDYAPTAIGTLYQRAKADFRSSVSLLIECGHELIAAKEAVPFGDWLLWLKAHRDELGFCDRTARRLMDAASKWTPASDLDDEEALILSRKIWGHEPPVPMEAEVFSQAFKRLNNWGQWVAKHPVHEVINEVTAEEARQIERIASETSAWLARLRDLLKPRLVAHG